MGQRACRSSRAVSFPIGSSGRADTRTRDCPLPWKKVSQSPTDTHWRSESFDMLRRMPLLPDAPDPATVRPVAGQPRVVFLRPLVEHPAVEVGDYTYYDHPTRAEHFA